MFPQHHTSAVNGKLAMLRVASAERRLAHTLIVHVSSLVVLHTPVVRCLVVGSHAGNVTGIGAICAANDVGGGNGDSHTNPG